MKQFILPEARMITRLQREKPGELLQPFATTSADRHPALFAFAQQRLESKVDARILSYGCSTGEEPCSLAEYLPNAAIDAVDINPRSIAIARRRAEKSGHAQINFITDSQPPDIDAVYDAVFCLSVLRHGVLQSERPATCSSIFPFTKYETALFALDRTIRVGGILFIWGSNFHFPDSKIARRYRPLDVPGMRPHGGVFYGPDNRLIENSMATHFAFEKTA